MAEDSSESAKIQEHQFQIREQLRFEESDFERLSNRRSQWFLRTRGILFPVFVKPHESIRLGEIVVAVDKDVRQTLDRTFQVRLRSLEPSSQFIVWNVVPALAHSHGHSLDRLFSAIDADEDENDGVTERCVRHELFDFLAYWIRQNGFEYKTLPLCHQGRTD
jgi:hypothetical protein